MFGGYFALKGLAEDSARRLNKLRTAYRQLESLQRENKLLTLLVLTDTPTQPSPQPEICPISFIYQFTPEFVDCYQQYQQGTTANILIDYAEGLERYVADMEEEIKNLQSKDP